MSIFSKIETSQSTLKNIFCEKLKIFVVTECPINTVQAGDGVNTLILSTDGNYCLNGGSDGRVELRDAWTLDLLHTFPKCDTAINFLAMTHDQQTLIAAMKSGSVVAFKGSCCRSPVVPKIKFRVRN